MTTSLTRLIIIIREVLYLLICLYTQNTLTTRKYLRSYSYHTVHGIVILIHTILLFNVSNVYKQTDIKRTPLHGEI